MTADCQYWKKCNICKKEIPFESTYYLCSVSTCRSKRTGLTFCSLECWDAHLGFVKHRSSYAEEARAPLFVGIDQMLVDGPQASAAMIRSVLDGEPGHHFEKRGHAVRVEARVRHCPYTDTIGLVLVATGVVDTLLCRSSLRDRDTRGCCVAVTGSDVHRGRVDRIEGNRAAVQPGLEDSTRDLGKRVGLTAGKKALQGADQATGFWCFLSDHLGLGLSYGFL